MSKVGIVVVSHSAGLAAGVAELATQMAPDVAVVPAGGLPDGGIGTDYDAVAAAMDQADSGAGVVLLYDLGSAQMTAELAVEMLGDPGRAVVADGPLVEGAVAAAVAAQGGADRNEVARAATAAAAEMFGAETAAPEERPEEAAAETAETVRIELTNEIGLHARPAALLARSVVDLDAAVTVRLGEREVEAGSVLGLMGLGARKGDVVEVAARGPEAAEALRRIEDLAARKFDEGG